MPKKKRPRPILRFQRMGPDQAAAFSRTLPELLDFMERGARSIANPTSPPATAEHLAMRMLTIIEDIRLDRERAFPTPEAAVQAGIELGWLAGLLDMRRWHQTRGGGRPPGSTRQDVKPESIKRREKRRT